MSVKSPSYVVLSLVLLARYVLFAPTHVSALSNGSGTTSAFLQSSNGSKSSERAIEIEKEKADIQYYAAKIQNLEMEKLLAESQNQLKQADKFAARINRYEGKIHKAEKWIYRFKHM